MRDLMSIWAQCQPVPVVPQDGDVRLDGFRYRRTADGWIVYVPMSGDWYHANPDLVPKLDALATPDA